jgi:dimethylargininase
VLTAITRAVSERLPACELTHLERVPIDIARARAQHAAYEAALAAAGTLVVRLPAADDLPDAVFVEDTAVVLDEVAVVTRLGARSRAAEADDIAAALAEYRPVRRLIRPATLDGGDVLRVGRTLYVGRSGRTNGAGVQQLRGLIWRHGYRVVAVPVRGCLHLKSAATLADDHTLVLNPQWVPEDAFTGAGLDILRVPEEEPWGANVLRIGDVVLVPDNVPRTRALLASRGLAVRRVNVSELQKAEAGVTCMSIVLAGTSAL